MRISQSRGRGTGKRTAYALAECALIMVMRSDRRMRPMPSFPTVCTSSSLPRKRESSFYAPRDLRPSGAGEKPPRYRCGVGILGWRECQESRASNAVIPAQAGIHLRAQRRSRPERGTSPRATVRSTRAAKRAVSSLPNCCACYAHTGWSADQRLKFSVEEAASFGRASSHIWVHVVESRSSDSGLARLRAANPGKTGRPVG